MNESFRALCSDFYVNQRLNLKLDLPRKREPILDTFERVRRQYPSMTQFKRYRDELALESDRSDSRPKWLAVRTNDIRSGSVNPPSLQEAYAYHAHILEIAPFFLSISPLDVEFVELLYGFDLGCSGNHDQCVFDALYASAPVGRLLDPEAGPAIDCQPFLALRLEPPDAEPVEVEFEVKTRSGRGSGGSGGGGQGREGARGGDPISVYLTLRHAGPVREIRSLASAFAGLARAGEALIESRVVPHLIVPIREAINSGGA